MRTALVTGGTSGIGRAVALKLTTCGYKVIAMGRNQAALSSLAQDPMIQPLAIDLLDSEGLNHLLKDVEVDVLVNNAGIMCPLGPFHTVAESVTDELVRVNLIAPITITRLLAPRMIQNRRGHIFFTGSTAGHQSFSNMAVYCASKAAVSAFAQAIRCDLEGSGVRVTEIVAGRTETDLYDGLLDSEVRKRMYEGGGAVQPDNIADMIEAVLNLPPNADVARFDILPHCQTITTGKH